MADFISDLNTALTMFKSSTNELSMQRALGSANDAVQQIKSADANDQTKRSQLQNVSNQLVTHLAAYGAPATTMQEVAGAIGPKQYANANAMNADAVLTGNAGLGAEAKQQQAFEEDPLNKRLAAKYRMDKNAAQSEKQMEFNQKSITTYGDDLNASKANARTAFGQTATNLGGVDRVKAVMGDPSQWGDLTDGHFSLMADALVKVSKGGVGTENEIKALVPPGASKKSIIANIKKIATGDPQGLQAQKYAQMFSNIIDNEADANNDIQQRAILQRATNSLHLNTNKRALPDGTPMDEAYKRTTATALRNAGVDVTPDDVVVDPRTKAVTTRSIQQADMSQQYIKKAYAAMSQGDANDKAKAKQVFDAFNIDPTNMPMSMALKTVPAAIRTGRIKFNGGGGAQ